MSAPEFTPRPQLAEDVARFVRRRIFNGTYPAGDYIRLDQLAAELGISVTPVREALFELRGEGLLDQLPRRGFVVLPFTDRDITDVSICRPTSAGNWRRGRRRTSMTLHSRNFR